MRGDWRDWWISIQSPLCSYWDQLLLPKVTCSDNGGFQFLPGRGQERVGRPVGVLILFVCVRVVCLQAGYLLGWLQGLLLCPGQGLDGVGELLVDDHVGGVSDGGVLTPGLLSLLSRREEMAVVKLLDNRWEREGLPLSRQSAVQVWRLPYLPSLPRFRDDLWGGILAVIKPDWRGRDMRRLQHFVQIWNFGAGLNWSSVWSVRSAAAKPQVLVSKKVEWICTFRYGLVVRISVANAADLSSILGNSDSSGGGTSPP